MTYQEKRIRKQFIADLAIAVMEKESYFIGWLQCKAAKLDIDIVELGKQAERTVQLSDMKGRLQVRRKILTVRECTERPIRPVIVTN